MNIIIVIIISAQLLLSAYTLLFMLKHFKNQFQSSSQPSKRNNQQLFTIKMQAYERIILYVERIDLEGLIMRTFLPNMTAQQLQTALLRTIREEFEHNITQQLYVTDITWNCVENARKLVLSFISQLYNSLSPSDEGIKLAQLLLSQTQDLEKYNFAFFTSEIKKEMRKDIALL